MRSPLLIDDLCESTHLRSLRRYRILLVVEVLWTLVAIAFFAETDARTFLMGALAGVVLFLFTAWQYWFVFRPLSSERELSQFIIWIYLMRDGTTMLIASFLIIMGVIQWYLQTRVGGLELLAVRYGLVFEAARHEWWRFLTGPFFHSGIPHWIGNFAWALPGVRITAPFCTRARLFLTAAAGILLPCLFMAWGPAWTHESAFFGVSGGICAVYGIAAGMALRHHESFPRLFGVMVLIFLVATTAASFLMNAHASNTAHLGGLLLGLFSGATMRGLADRPMPLRRLPPGRLTG